MQTLFTAERHPFLIIDIYIVLLTTLALLLVQVGTLASFRLIIENITINRSTKHDIISASAHNEISLHRQVECLAILNHEVIPIVWFHHRIGWGFISRTRLKIYSCFRLVVQGIGNLSLLILI